MVPASILCPFVLCRSPRLSGVPHPVPIGLRGQEPESPPQSPSLSGFQPGATSVSQRRLARQRVLALLHSSARPSPACAFAAAALTLAGSGETSPRRPSPVEARAASASPRLPREGARQPPRLHPLRGAAAIWGPCQARLLGARAQLLLEDEAPRIGERCRRTGRSPASGLRRAALGDAPRGRWLKRVAADWTRAPLVTSATLYEKELQLRTRQGGPTRALRTVLPVSVTSARCGLATSRLPRTSPPRAGRRKLRAAPLNLPRSP